MALRDIILAQPGLVSFWEGTDAYGSATLTDSKSGHDGTFDTNTLPGMFGLDFQASHGWKHNGATSNATISVADHPDFDTLTHSFEICLLILQHVRGINESVWLKGSNMPQLQLSESGSTATPRVCLYGGSIITTGTASLTDNHLWHHLAFTCNGAYNTIKLYLDGVDITGAYTSQTLSTNTTAASIGGEYQPMLYCNAAFYNTVLSPADVTNRWTAVQDQRFYTKKPIMIGVHTDSFYTGSNGTMDSQIASIKSINSKIARSTMRWDVVQTTSGGAYDWSRLDEYVRICNQNQIIPWLYPAGSPTWANGGADRWVVPGTGVDATFQTWTSQFQTFIGDFVDRYKPGGSGPYTIPEASFWIELWNEPNLSGFWNNAAAGGPDADQFAYWYRNMRSTILTHYPQAKVVMAGLSSWSAVGSPSIVGETFLRSVVGSTQWQSAPIDYAAYHPYSYNDDPDANLPFDNHYNDILPMKTVLIELGYPSSPICISEVGISDATSQADQATKLDTMLNRAVSEWSNITPVYIHFCVSDAISANYGLFTDQPTDGSASIARKQDAATFSSYAKPPSYWELKA